MAYQFPNTPAEGDVYQPATGASYTFTEGCWRRGSAGTGGYVLKSGDTMSGPLVLPSSDPAAAQHATHKQYVDKTIATMSLYQGTWQVAANVPDLDPAVMLPLNGYSWTCQTANPNIPEIAPATIPGIAGLTIAAGDTVKWSDALQVYELIRAAIGIARMIISDTPPAVALHGQNWWDSDAGKMYVRYEDPSGDAFWVQTSGGGGGSRYVVPIGDVMPTAIEEGELFFNSADATLYIWYDDGTGAQWVDVSA